MTSFLRVSAIRDTAPILSFILLTFDSDHDHHCLWYNDNKKQKWTTTPTTASDNCNIHAKLAQFNSSLYEGINSYGRWWTLETGAVRAPLWNISQYQEWFNYRWSIIPHHHDCRRRINVLIFHTYTHYYAVCATAIKTVFLSFLSFSSSRSPLQ